jgi:acyl dehydratase
VLGVAVGEGVIVGVCVGVGVPASATAVPDQDVATWTAVMVSAGDTLRAWVSSSGRRTRNHTAVNMPSTTTVRTTNSQGIGDCWTACCTRARIALRGAPSRIGGFL